MADPRFSEKLTYKLSRENDGLVLHAYAEDSVGVWDARVTVEGGDVRQARERIRKMRANDLYAYDRGEFQNIGALGG